MNTKHARIYCVSEAVSPISHMARTEGNEAVIQRTEVMTSKGRRSIPSLTGNMLRSVCIREPGAKMLVDAWGLHGNVSKRVANFLFHGGTMSQGGSRVDTRRTAEFYRLFPLGRLLGGCFPDEIIPGNLDVDFGWLVCRENARAAVDLPALSAYVPATVGGSITMALRPAEDFVGSWTYYQRSVDQTRPELSAASTADLNLDGSARENANGKDERSIFAGGCVVPGAVFVHSLFLRDVTDLEIGAVLCSLGSWTDRGGFVGGMRARGHGRLRTSVYSDDFTDVNGLMQQYADHVASKRDECVAWLNATFKAKAPVEKKGKAKKSALTTEGA